eukprot:3321745-Rhodomonas_salina.1
MQKKALLQRFEYQGSWKQYKKKLLNQPSGIQPPGLETEVLPCSLLISPPLGLLGNLSLVLSIFNKAREPGAVLPAPLLAQHFQGVEGWTTQIPAADPAAAATAA